MLEDINHIEKIIKNKLHNKLYSNYFELHEDWSLMSGFSSVILGIIEDSDEEIYNLLTLS